MKNGKCVFYDGCEDLSKISCRKDTNCPSTATKKYYCCDYRCSEESFCEKKLVTIFTPVAVCIFIAVVIVSNIFRHRRQRIHRARQTQVLTNNEAQAQVYQNYQAPPPYQPEGSCYPPPEYKQHQSEMSTSYNPAMIREDEPPPPYSAEQQGESGGQVRAYEAS